MNQKQNLRYDDLLEELGQLLRNEFEEDPNLTETRPKVTLKDEVGDVTYVMELIARAFTDGSIEAQIKYHWGE